MHLDIKKLFYEKLFEKKIKEFELELNMNLKIYQMNEILQVFLLVQNLPLLDIDGFFQQIKKHVVFEFE
jgi:hypothetical protein